MNDQLRIKKYIFCILLIGVALTERLWWDLGPNVELVTAATFIAAFYISRNAAVVVGITSLAITDIFLGNTNISLFTWSAYAMIAWSAYFLKQFAKMGSQKIIWGTFGGVWASLWFYVWTNFGVWWLDTWRMYPDTLQGLLLSYIAGLPFLKSQLLGNLILVPLGLLTVEMILNVSSFMLFFRKILFKETFKI